MPPYVKGASTATHRGVQWRKHIKIEKAVRLQITGLYTDGEIAQQIGVTPAYFSLLKQHPIFKSRMIQAHTGVISAHDADIQEDVEYQHTFIKSQVPVALQKLASLLMSKNETVAFKAAAEILDRDGNHAKVSRSSIEFNHKVDDAKQNKAGQEIMAILSGQPLPQQQNIDATMDEFTKGAIDVEKAQLDMDEVVSADALDKIDASKISPTIN